MAKKSIQHDKDTCPYCSSEYIEWWDELWRGEEGYGEKWHCQDCDGYWTKWYERKYSETFIDDDHVVTVIELEEE